MSIAPYAKHLIAFAAPIVLALVMGFAVQRPGVPDFQGYVAGPERKQAFFEYLLPLVEQRNQEILQTRRRLQSWNRNRHAIGGWDERRIKVLAQRYRVDAFDIHSDADWQTLLRRVDVVPPSLALVQAANESAWGTSRFAQQGYNFFGQWCFEAGCGLVPSSRDAGKRHEVAVYDSPRGSVESYIRNLNTHAAYRPLRELRAQLRAADKAVTGAKLAAGLERYSERGSEYISELRAMIRHNELSQYDL
jgi:Bax protein